MSRTLDADRAGRGIRLDAMPVPRGFERSWIADGLARRRRRRLLCCLVAAGALAVTHPVRGASTDIPSILWIDPVTNTGVYDPAHRRNVMADDMLNWLIDHLGQYRNSVTKATAARSMALLESTDGICYATLKKTPDREKFIAFSDALFWSLPERLIVLETTLPLLAAFIDRDGQVDLAGVLADPSLKGLRERSRAYPPPIEAAFATASGTARLVDVPKETDSYAMLAGRHGDWLIGHPTEARRHFQTEFPDLPYRSLPIKGSDQPFEIFAGCSRRPAGLRIIADIDAQLRAVKPRDALQDLYDRWMNEAERVSLHRFIDAQGHD